MSEIHAGHRARLTKRALSAGLDEMPKHEALEFLLGFVLPRGDVNPLAHRLIDRFGTVEAVLHADRAELTGFSGLGEQAAEFLLTLGEAVDAYRETEFEPESLAERTDADAVLKAYFAENGDKRTVFLMNSAFRVLEHAPCDVNSVIRAAVTSGASTALAAAAGEADIETLSVFAGIEEALGRIGIPLVNCAFLTNGNIRYMKDEWGTIA